MFSCDRWVAASESRCSLFAWLLNAAQEPSCINDPGFVGADHRHECSFVINML